MYTCTKKKWSEQELDYKLQDSAPVSFLDSESLIQTANFLPKNFHLFCYFSSCIVISPFNMCKHYKLLASFTCSHSIETASHTQPAGDTMRPEKARRLSLPLLLPRLPLWVLYVQHLWPRSVWRSSSPRQQTHASTPAVGPDTGPIVRTQIVSIVMFIGDFFIFRWQVAKPWYEGLYINFRPLAGHFILSNTFLVISRSFVVVCVATSTFLCCCC